MLLSSLSMHGKDFLQARELFIVNRSAPALARLPPEHPERSFVAFLKSRGRHGFPHYSELTESSWDVAKHSMRVIDLIIVLFLSFCLSEAKDSGGMT